jgi:hypothetical protein
MSSFRTFRRLVGVIFGALLITLHAFGQGIFFSEIMYHPAGTNVLDAWFELENSGPSSISLAGWRLTRGVTFTFPPQTSIPAGGHLVVAADAATFNARHPSVSNVVAGWTGTLSHDGEELRLVDASDNLVASITYAPEGDWALRRLSDPDAFDLRGWQWFAEHRGLGKSLERINAGLPNGLGQNWGSSVTEDGTPGLPNSNAETNSAPLLDDVRHAPAVPTSADPVTITVRLIDEIPNGLQATVHWRQDGQPTFQTAALFDDGAHGDGLALDGLFGVILPPQPHGTLIEFHLTARDADGRERAYPRVDSVGAENRTAYLAYQVDDTLHATDQPLHRLLLTRAEYDYLADRVWNDEPLSDAAVNGTFISTDGVLEGGTTTQVRYLCDVRNRGHGTRRSNPHNIHIGFPKDRPWKDRTGLNLNTQYTHAQQLGSALFRRSGVAMTESRPVQVRINGAQLAKPGQEQFGSYAANDPMDNRFVQRQFPLDAQGNLYRGIRDMIPGVDSDADLAWHGPDFAAYTNAYTKENHAFRNDWSDFIQLLDVLNHAPDATYAQELQSVANVDQWMRYFAVNTLLDNRENSLGNGQGDDFGLYRGTRDTRFVLIPYDMDAVLGRGTRADTYADGLWRMTNIAVIDRFMKHPEFVPLYFQHLDQLAHSVFSPEQMNPFLDQQVGSYISPLALSNLKAFNESHRNHVLSRYPHTLTVTHSLPVTGGFPSSSSPTLALQGTAHPATTRSVTVRGEATVWSAWQGTWTATNVALHPGINRIEIRALGLDGSTLETVLLEVVYDDGSVASAPSSITTDTTWTANGGPYAIDRTLTIAPGATLTVEPGTSVYLGPDADLVVDDGGRLLALGSEAAPIHFRSPPGTSSPWGGVIIRGGADSPETRLSHVHLAGNGTTCIESLGGTVALDHLSFGTPSEPYVSLDDSSFVVSHCHFPATTDSFEPFHGSGGIKPGGRGIIRHCFFGSSRGYSDIIDFTGGNRPNQPILEFYNNVFTGSTDDILDLDGTDAWIEGNIFLHVHRDGSPDSASAVSGGSSGGATSEITLLGNLFFDCDNAVTAKQGNFYTLLHNTIVHITKTGGEDFGSGVVNLRDTTPEITTFGRGAYLEGNIILDAESLVRNDDRLQSTVTLVGNLLPFPWTGSATNNPVLDPLFEHLPTVSEAAFDNWEDAQVLRHWFSLRPGSPARATGTQGRDLGGVQPRGAFLSGEPPAITPIPNATLSVGIQRSGFSIPTNGFPLGSGFTHFRWRLNNGPWSAETPIDTPIALTDLPNGTQVVEVSARNDAGTYQDDPALGLDAGLTRSRSWTVDRQFVPPPAAPSLRINEVLAHNRSIPSPDPTHPDLIELHNHGTDTVDLSGMGLTDNIDRPHKFTFPSGTRLEPGAFLVLLATASPGGSVGSVGFGLKQEGDDLSLFDAPERGGQRVDSIHFGLQLPDLAIGRRTDGSWGLVSPTFGAPNIALPTGDPRRVRINEWLTDAQFAAATDFVELFNPEPLPVDLGGFLISDTAGSPARFTIPPLTFIAGRGRGVFIADGNPQQGPQHLTFRLSSDMGVITFNAPDRTPLDAVVYGPQRTDVSQGRSPDGSAEVMAFPIPTPGGGNPGVGTGECTVSTVTLPLLPMDATWRYQQDANLDGAGWHLPSFDDSAWPSGPALLAVETSTLPSPGKQTDLVLGRTTYYFRTQFLADTNLSDFQLRLSMVVDDGALVFLNGQPIWTNGLSTGTPSYSTRASRNVGNASTETILVPAHAVIPGTNVVAAEVHQVNSTSTDVVWGFAAEAFRTFTNCAPGSVPTLALNEILAVAAPGSLASGFIEVINFGEEPASLAGLSLTDDADAPTKWTFAPDTTLAPGQVISIACDADQPASRQQTGFRLPRLGGAVFLFQARQDEQGLVDAVRYGLQITDFSIGRFPPAVGPWNLAQPTPGETNVPSALAPSSALRLNEWMADPVAGSDWLELHNTASQPVALGGLFLTDDFADTTRSPIAPLSFLGTGADAFVLLAADGNPGNGSDHVNFSLKKSGEALAILSATGTLLDGLNFGPQLTGVSEGRLPDGGASWGPLLRATPGSSNQPSTQDSDGDGMTDAWELEHFLTLARDGQGDFDGDGATDGAEFLAGTHPTDPADVLRFMAISVSGSVFLEFEATLGRAYSLQFRDSLEPGVSWQRLTDIPPQPTAGRVTVTDTLPAEGVRFYRLLLTPP